jgi:hypothetical protein
VFIFLRSRDLHPPPYVLGWILQVGLMLIGLAPLAMLETLARWLRRQSARYC